MVVVPLATNLRLAEAPGNVLLPSRASRLTRDAVAVVSQVTTLERRLLRETPARLEGSLLAAVDEGLRLLLGILP
jgi:mRNA interferase MazF